MESPNGCGSNVLRESVPAVQSMPGANNELKSAEKSPLKKDPTSADGSDLDLECFGKKKKKKKKLFNLDDLAEALPEEKTELQESGPADICFQEDAVGLDFIKTKKKKSKRKNLESLVSGGEGDGSETGGSKENLASWAESDRDYTYDELLKRAFDKIYDKNPELASGRKPKLVMKPPEVLRIGIRKTSFVNFLEIARTLHRAPKHLLDFILSELGTSGSLDGSQQLIIRGRFQAKQIENVLRRYIKEYVSCHTCRSLQTILQKDTRLFFLQCESCGSRCSVASVKVGFQALTAKRAAIRAKTV